ncbi:hypothetical protein M0813_16758 [Anaeramoeba flamelloides]|uniref:EF-hand domain-containing protein n=1 Tax=Anaeramoeba flamelloides TaxID=1746091 RepID=A0ABQ8YYN5_9EUKA|nr:hypothetical protein M0813_16758 [Anaeramoeba flamelloides]
MIKKQRPTNQQIAVQNILNYKISQQNERKLDSLLDKVLNTASPLFTKLKQGTKPKINCGTFTSHSQPNYRELQQNKMQITKKTFFSQSQKAFRTPNNLNRNKVVKMMALCPTYPVSKHKQKILLNSLTRKRAFLQNKSVSKRLRFNDKTTANPKKSIHNHHFQKDLFEQMILINNNGHGPKSLQRQKNKGSYTLLNRHKPQLIFKRPKPTKKFFKKKSPTNLKNEIYFNDPKKNQVTQTITQPNLKNHSATKKRNSPQKVKLLNYSPNTVKKRNKLLFVTKPSNQGEFIKNTEYCKNNSTKIELKKNQRYIEMVNQQKTKLHSQNANENEKELIIKEKEKEKPRYFEIQNNTKMVLKLLENNNNQNYNLNKNKNILNLEDNDQNKEIEKNNSQRTQLQINVNVIEDEFDFENENENKNMIEIPSRDNRSHKNSNKNGNTNESIRNFDNTDNIYINADIQSWNKLSVFENFQKDRQGSIEFPEFYTDFDKNQSFYQYFFKKLFNNQSIKKKEKKKKKKYKNLFKNVNLFFFFFFFFFL